MPPFASGRSYVNVDAVGAVKTNVKKLLLGLHLKSLFASDFIQSFIPLNLGLPRPDLVCSPSDLVLPSPDRFISTA